MSQIQYWSTFGILLWPPPPFYANVPQFTIFLKVSLRLMWGWDELESKFRWNWVELGLSLVNVELIKKLCFHRIRVMVLNIFWSTHTAEQYLFLCFLQFLLLMLSNFFQFKGCFGLFGPKCAILSVTIRFRNCFGVYSYSATTFIFYVSFNSDIWFWLNFGVVFDIWGLQWAIFGFNVGFKNSLGVNSYSWTTFIFYDFLNSDI